MDLVYCIYIYISNFRLLLVHGCLMLLLYEGFDDGIETDLTAALSHATFPIDDINPLQIFKIDPFVF